DERDREIEPHDQLRATHDELAEHAVVRRVGYPIVALRGGCDSLAENIRTARLPVRAVMQRVDLDVPDAKCLGELGCAHRLAAAGGAGDRNARHRWNSPRATTTADPPTSTRSTASMVPSTRAKSVACRPISMPCAISISSPNAIRPWRA